MACREKNETTRPAPGRALSLPRPMQKKASRVALPSKSGTNGVEDAEPMGQGAVQTGKHSGNKPEGEGPLFALNPQMGAIQPLQAHAGDKVKAPGVERHPQVGRKGEWEQLQIMKEISPLQQEGDHQGPGGRFDKGARFTRRRGQGVEGMAFGRMGDENGGGAGLAGEQFPRRPRRFPLLAAPSVSQALCYAGRGVGTGPEVRGRRGACGSAGRSGGDLPVCSERSRKGKRGER